MEQLAAPVIRINNVLVPYTPNSVEFDEGLGEQTMTAASLGNGASEPIYANNIETNFSMFKFEMPTTEETIRLARSWKVNRNQNLIEFEETTADGTTTRVFSEAALLSNYAIGVGSEKTIPLEFKSRPAV